MIDLFSGLGGWAEGGLAVGYDVIGFDIERHEYGNHRYPAQLVIQDVLTLHGSQFRDATLIVASPPCQGYSYRAMPWSRAKALPPPDNTLFEACFRIQREASEAAGRRIPLIVENVRGAQKWIGRARWNFGSFYLWGDVPALMPIIGSKKNNGGSWFVPPPGRKCGAKQNPDGRNPDAIPEGVKQRGSGDAWWDKALDERRKEATQSYQTTGPLAEGFKGVGGKSWVRNPSADPRPSHGNSKSRKAASALIAKIPLSLSTHIAQTFLPTCDVAAILS